MSLPFRNTDKSYGIYPANSVVSIFDKVEDAEAAIKELDELGLGEDVVYARGAEMIELSRAKNQGVLAHVYRALQAVMSDELPVIRRYEKKVAEGSSFVMVPLSDASDVDRVGVILNAHHPDLAHFLGRGSFRVL